MTLSRAHRAGRTGAKGICTFTLSNGAQWVDSFRIDVDGAEIAGADTSAWSLIFRDDDGNVVLTISESSGLTVTQSTDYTLFAIDVSDSVLSALEGDYSVDLVEVTSANKKIHWLHGTATVFDEPLVS